MVLCFCSYLIGEMAAATDPCKALDSTPEKTNFQRAARLLICGGTMILREIFDKIHPPKDLPTILNDPAIKSQLTACNKDHQTTVGLSLPLPRDVWQIRRFRCDSAL